MYMLCLQSILGKKKKKKLVFNQPLRRRAGEWRVLFRRAFRVSDNSPMGQSPALEASNDQSPTPDEESTPAVPAQAAAGADGGLSMDGTSIPRDNSW